MLCDSLVMHLKSSSENKNKIIIVTRKLQNAKKQETQKLHLGIAANYQ